MNDLAFLNNSNLGDGCRIVCVSVIFFCLFLNYTYTSFLYSVLFKTVNVAKKLETSWLQPAGMLYKQEKLLVRHAFSQN